MARKVFKTYKEDFPLFLKEYLIPSKIVDMDELFKDIILEISKVPNIPEPYYVSRHHGGEDIPPNNLSPFKEKYKSFVAKYGTESEYTIPIVWIAVDIINEDVMKKLEKELETKGIKWFLGDGPTLSPAYCNLNEEKMFLEFLQHTTQICFNLLNTQGCREKIMQFRLFEFRKGIDEKLHKMLFDSMLIQLKIYIFCNSKYYRENIASDIEIETKFWGNFLRIQGDNHWAHFLFNICGA